jgi:hypothetical protein
LTDYPRTEGLLRAGFQRQDLTALREGTDRITVLSDALAKSYRFKNATEQRLAGAILKLTIDHAKLTVAFFESDREAYRRFAQQMVNTGKLFR